MVTIAHVQNSNMSQGISGHFSIFGLFFFVLKSLLGITKHWICEKFAIMSLTSESCEKFNISNLGY